MTERASAEAGAAQDRPLTLTPEQALALAIERHKSDRLGEAETIYAALLARWPDHADVLNHMGVLQQQRGNHERAVALLRHALEMAPEAPGIWNNLGNVLLRARRDDEAEHAFRRSVALADNPEARTNLATALRRRKLWSESERECRRALAMAPEFGDAWHNLSLVLIGQDRIAEAMEAAHKAVVLLPPHKRRRETYTRALVLVGQIDAAIETYRAWLAEEPDNAYVRHHLAACGGAQAPERASDAYVEQVFDDFAATFDAKLARLRYRAPELVAEAMAAALPSPQRQFDIADIGCGTGLCGPLVVVWARRLWGCDLSAAMLEQAERRTVYDVLEKAELIAFLRAHPDSFDVVLSADTLCYFGALEGVADAAACALRGAGRLVFTVEALHDDDNEPCRLRANGRYAHAAAYLRTVLDGAGLRRHVIESGELRLELGVPVRGWVVTASRA